MNQQAISIDPLSGSSLIVQPEVNSIPLSKATGFIVQWGEGVYLITNWHVVSGRDSDSNQPLSPTAGIPDTINIVHHSSKKLGEWVIKKENLYKEGNPRWLEHIDGQRIDVVALPLEELGGDINTYPFDLRLADVDMILEPAMPVSIIGFPYGLSTAGGWPIWKTGHIASDPDLDYDGRPAFLIDVTARSGMSGSPVVLRLRGGYRTSKAYVMMDSGPKTRFIGVYSGRIHHESEIGRVWRPNVISEIMKSSSSTE